MALSVYKTWSAGEILTAADQNGSFNNILNNALSLISPLTGNLNCNTRQLTNLLLEVQASSQTAANEGRIYWQSTEDQIHVDDGTNQRRVPAIASVARGGMIVASATGQWAQLALGAAGRVPRSDGTDLVYSTFTIPDTGTSGGVLAYTATGTLASSAALTANGVVYGGGAGAAPSSTAQGGTNTVLIASAGAPSFSATPIINTSVQLGVASTATGSLILANSASASLTTFRAGNATEANTYIWPVDGGSANQLLTTDGATPTTTLSWTTVSVTAPVFAKATEVTTAFTTTATSFTDVTTATVTFTTGAFPIFCGFSGVGSGSATQRATLTVDIDGVQQGAGAEGLMDIGVNTALNYNLAFTYQSAALTAASHTAKVQAKTNTGTLTINAGTGVQYGWWCHEIR